MEATLSEFVLFLRRKGRAERTVQAYRRDVDRFVGWCEAVYGMSFEVGMVNAADLRDFEVWCRKSLGLKAASWNRAMASLGVWCRWLVAGGWLAENPVGGLTRAAGQKLAPKSLDAVSFRRFRLAVMNAVRLAGSEAARKAALRNQAVISLLVEAGMREGEVVNLRAGDLLLGERKGRVLIRAAKGNKDREIPLSMGSVQALKAWLEARPKDLGEWVFGGKFGERLQERGIQKLVGKLAEQAGVGHVTPHCLRHTAAYRWIKAGADLGEVAELLGHSSIEVTRRYTMPHWQDLEELVEAV